MKSIFFQKCDGGVEIYGNVAKEVVAKGALNSLGCWGYIQSRIYYRNIGLVVNANSPRYYCRIPAPPCRTSVGEYKRYEFAAHNY